MNLDNYWYKFRFKLLRLLIGRMSVAMNLSIHGGLSFQGPVHFMVHNCHFKVMGEPAIIASSDSIGYTDYNVFEKG